MAEGLRRYGVHMMVFEIFRSVLNKTIFVIDGEPPKLAQNFLSELSFGLLPRCLMLKFSCSASRGTRRTVPILIDEQDYLLERFHTATEVYLTPVGTLPISPGRKYALIRSDSGEYVIRPLARSE